MNRNAYIDRCLSELAKERARAQALAYSNLSKARSNSEFIEKDRQEKELSFQLGKLKAYGQKSAEIERELESIRKDKLRLLNEMNIDPSSLEPKYSCKKCNDLGYYNGGLCDCLRKRLNALLIKECGAGKDKLSDFKDFNEKIITDETQKTQLLKLKKKFEDLASSFPASSPKFMVISGKAGVGKTFLTECLAKALIDRSFLVSFVSAFGMNNMFLNYHTTFDEQKSSYINALIDPDVLVIDDLGTEPILKNVTREYLLVVLSERSRLNKLTVITTNLSPAEILSRYNERIFSRLCNKRESFLAQIEGKDLRLVKL